jgi:hypothetical protein
MTIPIDALYQAFVDSLPSSLRSFAAALPFKLGLAPSPAIPFSEVFAHEVTLAAPFLVAEAFPSAAAESVRCAVMAHALSVIEAFGSDRVGDGQVEAAPELMAVLTHLRQARNAALERIHPGASAAALLADQQSRAAILEERKLLRNAASVEFSAYEAISLQKQAVGFPASLALVRALGGSAASTRQVERALTGVWLGLQFEDDVVDWEDDWRNGGAWAVCLARSARGSIRGQGRPTEPDMVRRLVLGTGVLSSVLTLARRRYRLAWRHAQSIGAFKLAQWAGARDRRLAQLIPLEQKFAGYSLRARMLAPWAVEVLT